MQAGTRLASVAVEGLVTIRLQRKTTEMNKRLMPFAFVVAILLLAPAGAQAWQRHHRAPYPYVVHHRHSGDVAIGVLGGIVGGIILDRVLFPPRRVVVYEPYDPPPPSRYGRGYRNGYDEGYADGRDDGYREGYDTGYSRGRRYRKY
ncbi:MAG: hypothetical protein A3J75_08930 [Acidobacteria bacterium RBG_16_68_9]|nr:MAG: hypothetical protein A3J75_08930 [Acidobacteria bacterium RBG_16_68_9]